MIKVRKGAGGLSRKLSAILVLAAMPTLGFAVDNSIYIDQTGSNATISVTQEGAGNVVKGIRTNAPGISTDAAYINGDGVGVNISQVGSGNTLSLGVNTSTATGTGVQPTNITYSVTGGNNTGYIDLNSAGTSGANKSTQLSITQTGGGNQATAKILGSKNSATVNQADGNAVFDTNVNADNTVQSITTSGGTANSVTTDLTSNGGHVTVSAVGASNTVSIAQSNGTLGHTATVDITGSSNNISITQSSTVDSVANLKVNGGTNGYTILQKN